MWKIAVLVLVGLALGLSFADVSAEHISFGTITTGFIAKYHELPAGTFIQDLSGAATDGKVIIFADDGGNLPNSPSRPPAFIRVVREGLPDTQAVNMPLALEHKDLGHFSEWRFRRHHQPFQGRIREPALPQVDAV